MKKYKKILSIVWISCFVLALVAALGGFANGLSVAHKSGQEWITYGYESIYELMFIDRAVVYRNWGVLIAAFVCLMVAICIMVTVWLLNYFKKTYKHLNLALTITAITCLVVSAMFMFFMCPIICTPTLYSAKYIITLGAGSLIWAITATVAAWGLGATIFINKKFLKGAY